MKRIIIVGSPFSGKEKLLYGKDQMVGEFEICVIEEDFMFDRTFDEAFKNADGVIICVEKMWDVIDWADQILKFKYNRGILLPFAVYNKSDEPNPYTLEYLCKTLV